MSIQELSEKFKWFLGNTEYLLALLIVVVSLVSFYLGRVSATEIVAKNNHFTEETVSTFDNADVAQLEQATLGDQDGAQQESGDGVQNGGYVASKSGTKYHLPWCPGAKQMKESNKIYFSTKEEAEKAGYTPAANCKGI